MTTTVKKESDFTTVTDLLSGDYVRGIHDPLGIPTSVKITKQNFFANVAVPVNLTANLTITGSANFAVMPNLSTANLNISLSYTPTTSSDVTTKGKIWFDNTYLYVAVANNTIKRVLLSAF